MSSKIAYIIALFSLFFASSYTLASPNSFCDEKDYTCNFKPKYGSSNDEVSDSRRYPIRLTPADQRRIFGSSPEDAIAFANFYSNHEFWAAEIPVSNIKEAHHQIQENYIAIRNKSLKKAVGSTKFAFLKGLVHALGFTDRVTMLPRKGNMERGLTYIRSFHAQTKIDLKEPIKLCSLATGECIEGPKEFILTTYHAQTKDEKDINLVKALLGNYSAAHMVIGANSWQQEFAEQVNSGPVRTFRLDIGQEAKTDLIQHFINHGEKKQFNSRFSLLYANCAIYSLKNLFSSIEMGLGLRILNMIQRPFRFVPSQSPKMIRQMHIPIEELESTPFKYDWQSLTKASVPH